MERSHQDSWLSGIEGRGPYYAALARAMVFRLVVVCLVLGAIEGGVQIASAIFSGTVVAAEAIATTVGSRSVHTERGP